MAYLFPSSDWVKMLVEVLNADPGYAKAAATWEGDLNFIIEGVPGTDKNQVIYLDLWHGKCRGAGFSDETDMKPAAFRISAPLGNWKRVILKQIGPIPAMVSGQLRVHGNLPYILRQVAAALSLVDCAGRVPTEFPG